MGLVGTLLVLAHEFDNPLGDCRGLVRLRLSMRQQLEQSWSISIY